VGSFLEKGRKKRKKEKRENIKKSNSGEARKQERILLLPCWYI